MIRAAQLEDDLLKLEASDHTGEDPSKNLIYRSSYQSLVIPIIKNFLRVIIVLSLNGMNNLFQSESNYLQ